MPQFGRYDRAADLVEPFELSHREHARDPRTGYDEEPYGFHARRSTDPDRSRRPNVSDPAVRLRLLPSIPCTQLAERIETTVPPERRDALLACSDDARRLSAEDLTTRRVDRLLGIVRSAFAFVDARGNHPAIVRVFVPTIDRDGYRFRARSSRRTPTTRRSWWTRSPRSSRRATSACG